VIETRPGGYALQVGIGQLDLHRFETLADRGRRALDAGDPARASRDLGEALSLWRGPPLGDLADADFAVAAVARLEELRLRVLGFASGRPPARQACRLVPAGECRRSVLAKMSLPDARPLPVSQADALAAYRDARRRSWTGSASSGPSLQELERAILRQDASLESRGERRWLPAPTRR
jgi:hypothetical protein